MVGGLAIAMFVALVGFGGKYFGWTDPDGKVQLALVTAFILGIIGARLTLNVSSSKSQSELRSPQAAGSSSLARAGPLGEA
jgi:hypothetical protein